MKYQKKIHEKILDNTKSLRKEAAIVFKTLRDNLCETLESYEKNSSNADRTFHVNEWVRNEGGGGVSSILRGSIIEKAGVHLSTVYGQLPSGALNDQKSKESDFWASGISVVIHPLSPLMPAVHMNTRFIVTQKQWFGGGADITPTYKNTKQSKDLAKIFHKNLKNACDNYKKGCYKKFKKWCDEYFYLPHRKESRGLGGIFYDYLNTNEWDKDFIFTKNVGLTFIQTYLKIIELTARKRWSENDKAKQLFRRSRYVEFNLLHDRGTKFGLMTNGNTEAILMSLPPLASW